jgi:nucleoid DNA-binding protein
MDRQGVKTMTTYYETTFSGLVAVKPIRINEHGLFECRVTARKNKTYKTGEIITTTPYHLVHKTRQTKYQTYVTTVPESELFA